MLSYESWKEIYRRFDPKRAVGVERPEWRAQRPYSPIGEIDDELRLDSLMEDRLNRPRMLLLGTLGTGKTTELRLLADKRSSEDFVLILDLVHLFDRVVTNPAGLQRVNAWEVCYLVGLSLYHAAVERLNFPWAPDVLPALEAAWQAAAQRSGTDAPQGKLNLAKLASAVFQGASLLLDGGVVLGTSVKLVEQAAGAVDWNLPLGKARQPLPDDLMESRALIDAVNRIIGEVQHGHRRVLVLIDGLDRVQSVEQAQALFVESRLLSRFSCPVVICAPFVLRHHPKVQTVQGGFKIFVLVNEPVVRRDDPGTAGGDFDPLRVGSGFAFLHELFHLRIKDLLGPDDPAPISDDLLRELAYFSGGRARDFVRLIGEVAGKVLLARPPQRIATAAMVRAAIDSVRRSLEMGLSSAHIELLRKVRDDASHTLPDHPATLALLEAFWLLPYPNEHEWFYPHTLLLKRLA